MSQSGAGSEPAGWRAGIFRLAIGLAQGLVCYALFELKAVGHNEFTTGVGLAAVLAPLILLADLRTTPWRPMLIWFGAAGATVFSLGVWSFYRDAGAGGSEQGFPFMAAWACAVLLFIAHHLIVAAILARRWIAPYVEYFDMAWRHAVQLALSLAFVGVFWLVMVLGAALFKLIGIDGLQTLIGKDWFNTPVSFLMFAAAVHISDMRAALVLGIRTIILTLLGYLLPLVVVLAAAFLGALPFTGLHALGAANSAAAILLGVTSVLTIFLNAVYQDGAAERQPPAVLRWALRLSPFLLLILVPLAAYELVGRVMAHGWTPERVTAMACIVAGAAHMGGYVWASLSPGRPMARLEIVNVLSAALVVVVMLALLSPVADPARVSVDSQLAALSQGKVTPQAFDYEFLGQRSARFGREALERLYHSANPQIAVRAKATRVWWNNALAPTTLTAADISQRIKVFPAGQTLPLGLISAFPKVTDSFSDPSCLTGAGDCTVRLVDLDHDGQPEAIVAGPSEAGQIAAIVFKAQGPSHWAVIGALLTQGCGGIGPAFLTGRIAAAAPAFDDVLIDGARLRFSTDQPCITDTEKARIAKIKAKPH